MNLNLKNYLHSFKFKKDFWYTLLVDVIFVAVISLILSIFYNLITKKAYLLSQGKTTEELKQMLLSMDPVAAQNYLVNLKSVVINSIIGLLLVVVLGFWLYSYSRKKIWNYLTKHKTKYWKWNFLNLVLIIPALLYLIFFALVKLILSSLVATFKNQVFLSFFNSFFNLFSMLVFIIFVFLTYYQFSRKYEVWNSIGQAFHLIKKRWNRIWPLFLLSLITAIVISTIPWLLGILFSTQTIILGITKGVIFNGAIFLIYLIWFRLYLFKTIRE